MEAITRREFVARSSIALTALAGLPAVAAGKRQFHGHYGVQMYSIREEMKKDAAAALRMVHSLGYTEIEAWQPDGVDAKTLRPQLDAAGLKATGMHTVYDALGAKLDDVIANAKGVGAEWVVCAWVDEKLRQSADDYRRLAADFSQIGGKLHDAGLRLGYHNHAVEFVKFDGKPALDLLIEQTDPKLVWFELDVGHVKRGGEDPVAYLNKYASRIKLLHLKDLKVKAGAVNPGPEDYDDVVLGTGILGMPALLKAASDARVERYYVEEEAGDVENRLRQDYRYLKRVTL